MNLPRFILARIAEDEAVAQDSLALYGPGSSLYVARHDPAYVLAECEAKRRIVKYCHENSMSDARHAYGSNGGRVMSLLALPYADHPDYRETWRP